MADSVDWGQAEDNLKQKAGQWYDPSMLDDLKRNAAAGQANNEATQATVDDWTNRIANKAQLRGSNEKQFLPMLPTDRVELRLALLEM